MQLEEYFEFDNPNGIRIKGTRVGVEDVVYLARAGQSPGRIRQELPTLTLEQVHAALTYYYHNRAAVDSHMKKQEAEWEAEMQQHEAAEKPEIVRKLLALKAARESKVAS